MTVIVFVAGRGRRACRRRRRPLILPSSAEGDACPALIDIEQMFEDVEKAMELSSGRQILGLEARRGKFNGAPSTSANAMVQEGRHANRRVLYIGRSPNGP